MKKIILSAFVTLLLFSCGITKKSSQTDKSESVKTTERSTITRPGDTLRIQIPNIRYKDTTIRVVNYEKKTVASVYYDKSGNQLFECLSAETREQNERIIEAIKNDKEDRMESESEFKPQHFIYALAVFGLVIIVLMVVGMIVIARIKKSIPETILATLKQLKE